MNVWSQIAALGAVVAAFGPPFFSEADEEPDRATLPTIDVGDQPVAAASIDAPAGDADANLLEDTQGVLAQPDADVPAPTRLPSALENRAQLPPRSRPKPEGRPRANVGHHDRTLPGAGQRYL
jgi:hypothetical protein